MGVQGPLYEPAAAPSPDRGRRALSPGSRRLRNPFRLPPHRTRRRRTDAGPGSRGLNGDRGRSRGRPPGGGGRTGRTARGGHGPRGRGRRGPPGGVARTGPRTLVPLRGRRLGHGRRTARGRRCQWDRRRGGALGLRRPERQRDEHGDRTGEPGAERRPEQPSAGRTPANGLVPAGRGSEQVGGGSQDDGERVVGLELRAVVSVCDQGFSSGARGAVRGPRGDRP